jgi:hypothetical protein
MWTKISKVLLIVLVPVLAWAESGPTRKLEGQYLVGSENLLDPGPNDKPDRVLLSLEGKTAEDMYKAMSVPARRVDCDGKNAPASTPRKIAGDLQCEGDATSGYVCTVGILLNSGKTTRGQVCD